MHFKLKFLKIHTYLTTLPFYSGKRLWPWRKVIPVIPTCWRRIWRWIWLWRSRGPKINIWFYSNLTLSFLAGKGFAFCVWWCSSILSALIWLALILALEANAHIIRIVQIKAEHFKFTLHAHWSPLDRAVERYFDTHSHIGPSWYH
jgi:hypothetical protein